MLDSSMSVRIVRALIPVALLFTALGTSAQETVRPHAGMLRYPDISATNIVFLYADDLWLVPREGGVAVPLASPPGQETRPKFSPDERTIAFNGNYDGNSDLYTVPTEGGVPFRVTYHPATEVLSDWTLLSRAAGSVVPGARGDRGGGFPLGGLPLHRRGGGLRSGRPSDDSVLQGL